MRIISKWDEDESGWNDVEVKRGDRIRSAHPQGASGTYLGCINGGVDTWWADADSEPSSCRGQEFEFVEDLDWLDEAEIIYKHLAINSPEKEGLVDLSDTIIGCAMQISKAAAKKENHLQGDEIEFVNKLREEVGFLQIALSSFCKRLTEGLGDFGSVKPSVEAACLIPQMYAVNPDARKIRAALRAEMTKTIEEQT